ncbi:MAG: hypothetical protein FWD17_12180 [Polyangiaceae bacterium]|nr:hypothetical protein [Polyangiaceae bacterium]
MTANTTCPGCGAVLPPSGWPAPDRFHASRELASCGFVFLRSEISIIATGGCSSWVGIGGSCGGRFHPLRHAANAVAR